MNCPRCGEDHRGEVCGCQLTAPALEVASHPEMTETHTVDVNAVDLSEQKSAVSLALSQAEAASENEDNSAWRDELSARLTRYRARRKMRPPRYPSLRLQFDAIGPMSEPVRGDMLSTAPIAFEHMSDRALALDGTMPPGCEMESPETTIETIPADSPPATRSAPAHTRAKIIEFPRFALDQLTFEPPAPPPDQLAEPVSSRPRILEVPEAEAPPPALGGITIEPVQRPENEKRIGIDVPLQSSALSRRIFASLIDGLIIGIASGIFGGIFWKVAAFRPPLVQILGLAVGITLVFWAAYQYLLLVYAASTPGLLAADLELTRFDGTSTSRPLRRWRVLASYLSAASLGMGYAWVFLDEDVLCWHDRITHTYLARKKRSAPDVPPSRQP